MPIGLTGDLFIRLRSFFEREEQELRQQLDAARRREQKAEALSDKLSADKERAERLNAELIERIESREGAVGGSIQLLNFDAVAKKLGPRWTAMIPRIHGLIDAVLTSQLSADEIYYRQGDNQYVVIFATSDEQAARRRCRALETAIRRKLLGEDDLLEDVDFKSSVGTLGPADPNDEQPPTVAIAQQLVARGTNISDRDEDEALSERIPSLRRKLKQVLQLLGHLAESLPKRLQSGTPVEPAPAVVERLERVVAMVREVEQRIAKVEAASLATTEPDATKVPADDREQASLTDVLDQALNEIRTELHQLQLAATGVPREERQNRTEQPASIDWSAAEISFSYSPVWQMRKQVLNVFRCGLTVDVGTTLAVIQSSVESEDENSLLATVDEMLLLKVVVELETNLDPRRNHLIIVPVHFSTLSSPKLRRHYTESCMQLKSEHQRYVIFEIIYPFVGVSNLPIANAISVVKPFGRAVLLRVGIDYQHFSDLASAGLYSVGTDLGQCSATETDLTGKINAFKTRTERSHLRAHIYGADSRSLAVIACGAGYDLIGGKAVATPIDSIDGMRQFSLASLFQRRGLSWAS